MKFVFLLLLILIFNFPIVFAEDLFITLTDVDSEIIIDGIWSHSHEWKKSSETVVKEDGLNQFALRYAHNYEKIFVLIDVIVDESVNTIGDKSVICFEDKTNENNLLDSIHCFENNFDGNLITLVGNSEIQSIQYHKIENSNNTVAQSGLSNEFDRYSKNPHVSYEFEIPIDLIGRSDVYGFYVGIYDAEKNLLLTWPQRSEQSQEVFIPNSDAWGQIISPDKSIPEFPSPLILFVILIGTILFIQFKTKLLSHKLFSF